MSSAKIKCGCGAELTVPLEFYALCKCRKENKVVVKIEKP